MEAYQQERFYQKTGHVHFIQDNEVSSRYGVIRGLHFQKGKRAQAKLVRVIQGNIIDIVVDLGPLQLLICSVTGLNFLQRTNNNFLFLRALPTAMPLFQKAPQYFIRWMRLMHLKRKEAFLHATLISHLTGEFLPHSSRLTNGI